MRTSNVVVSLGLVGLALGLSPASSFDGTRTPENAPVTLPAPQSPAGILGRAAAPLASIPMAPAPLAPPAAAAASAGRVAPTAFEALRSGTQALRDGKPQQAVTALEYAAGQGVPGAIWKLGRMYADGDGVNQ